MAIGIKLKKENGEHDLGVSKFFGTPTLPMGMMEELSPDAVFVAQLQLSALACFDKEDRLPHEGYLYIFLETEDDTPYSGKKAVVIYTKEEPAVAVDNFNEVSPMPNGLNEDYLIEFFEADDDYDGIKLFGEPSDWGYAEDYPELLLQFDPLATSDLDFFTCMDGYIYFFFGEDKCKWEDVVVHFEYS